MSIQAAQRMGLRCLSADENADCPAGQVAPSIEADLHDPEALAPLFGSCAVVTLENEFVPADVIRAALREVGRPESMVVPSISCLETIQDKLKQRMRLKAAGVPCPEAVPLNDDGALAVAKVGYPMVLKARFGGYDGKSIRYAKTKDDFEDLRTVWQDGDWLAEQLVPLKREVSTMVVRTPKEVLCFPTMETVQVSHVCDLVFPCELDASDLAVAAVEAVEGIGVFGVEMFEDEKGRLSVNEIAPRPHNTGHYTLDWGGISQFDQHIRVVIGVPPHSIDGMPTCMANLFGQPDAGDYRPAMVAALRQFPSVGFHWYGKAETRTGRKMGHINAVGSDCVEHARTARDAFYKAWSKRKADLVDD